MSVKIFYAKRKPQEETTRHENTRVGSKALLRFCVVLCCVVDLCLSNITAINTKEF
jgi:hypothetical protein